MRLFFFLSLFLLTFVSSGQTPAFINDSLQGYIAEGMKQWQIPGLSLVIVKDGKVLVSKGFGVRNLDSTEPVDENTLFLIASNTKLFTGTALALLENKGKLSLDDRITKYFPAYRLYDSSTSPLVTLRDLLSHRIGTKTFQGDFTFWNTSLSREEIMKRMRLLKPSQVFRQDFGYCNSCFLTAGQVIPAVTGQQWEDFIHDNILQPLQMSETLVLSTGIEKQANAARPYTTSYTGTLQRVPYDNWNNLAPAASIISNAHDLSHWLLFQLDSGRWKGVQIIPFDVLQKTRDVNTVLNSRKSASRPMHFIGYGLGLFAGDYLGRQVYWHTGGAGGMVSNVCFVPEERLGIAILTNNDNQGFFEALRYQILDAYLGLPFQNHSRRLLPGFQQEMKDQLDSIASWKERTSKGSPELPVSAYAGVYSNDLYGNISISQLGNRLKISFGTKPDLSATLDYMDHGQWLMQYNNIEYGIFPVGFDISGGKVRSVTTRQNEFVEYDPYTFTKKVPTAK